MKTDPHMATITGIDPAVIDRGVATPSQTTKAIEVESDLLGGSFVFVHAHTKTTVAQRGKKHDMSLGIHMNEAQSRALRDALTRAIEDWPQKNQRPREE